MQGSAASSGQTSNLRNFDTDLCEIFTRQHKNWTERFAAIVKFVDLHSMADLFESLQG
jgi:hypothetical protein